MSKIPKLGKKQAATKKQSYLKGKPQKPKSKQNTDCASSKKKRGRTKKKGKKEKKKKKGGDDHLFHRTERTKPLGS